MQDFYDVDFIKEPDFELPIILESMYNSLCNMYEELSKNLNIDNGMYNPKWVKQLIKYNI